MEPKPAQKVSSADLLRMSQALGEVRDLLMEVSLALHEALFQQEGALRDEAGQQMLDVLDQIRSRQSGPSND